MKHCLNPMHNPLSSVLNMLHLLPLQKYVCEDWVYIYVHMYMYACACVYVCACAWACVCIYVCMYVCVIIIRYHGGWEVGTILNEAVCVHMRYIDHWFVYNQELLKILTKSTYIHGTSFVLVCSFRTLSFIKHPTIWPSFLSAVSPEGVCVIIGCQAHIIDPINHTLAFSLSFGA